MASVLKPSSSINPHMNTPAYDSKYPPERLYTDASKYCSQYQVPVILSFQTLLFLFATHSLQPSIKTTHTHRRHHCPHTNLTAVHATRIAGNPFLIVPSQHRDIGLMGLMARPLLLQDWRGCIGTGDDLRVKRKKQRERERKDQERERQ